MAPRASVATMASSVTAAVLDDDDDDEVDLSDAGLSFPLSDCRIFNKSSSPGIHTYKLN